MSPRDLGTVLCAVAGLLVIVVEVDEAIGGVAILAMRIGGGDVLARAVFAFVGLLPLLIGVAMVRYRRQIATRLFPSSPSSEPSISLPELQQALLFVLGVYLFARGLASLFASTVQAYRSSASIFAYTYVAELAMGLALCLGSRGLLGAIYLLHRAGRDRPHETTE